MASRSAKLTEGEVAGDVLDKFDVTAVLANWLGWFIGDGVGLFLELLLAVAFSRRDGGLLACGDLRTANF